MAPGHAHRVDGVGGVTSPKPDPRSSVTGTPAVARPLALLDDIALAARRYKHDYWVRHAEHPDVLVLAGRRVWEELLVALAREAHHWWRIDPLKDEVVALDGAARIVSAGIAMDEWRLTLLTEWMGSTGQ